MGAPRSASLAGACALLLLLAGCGGGPEPRRVSSQDMVGGIASPAFRQCRAALNRDAVRYTVLPDRTFDGGCRAVGAVQLLDIGVPVSGLKAMTCPLALHFSRWTATTRGIVRETLGSELVRIESFGTYACRPRNGQVGGRLSEHGFANAVDVAAFVLADGRRITVERGWTGADLKVRDFLRRTHRAGCKEFQIGLGPESDRFHYNHFHFDMGRGPYCR